jgi:hypothetical protein
MKLRHLTEKLSKYLDRPIVDYWRTVQGVNVGFRGNPGEGVPIAGPPVLTGGAGSKNPLLKPLLKKHKKGTFIGNAIRKKNFPLSVVNFIEGVVGGSEEEIQAEFERVRKGIENASTAWGPDDVGYKARAFVESRHLKGAEATPESKAALNAIRGHFNYPGGNSSLVYKYIESLGVAGTSGPYDKANEEKYDSPNEIFADLRTTEEAMKSVLRDMYIANQIAMGKRKTSTVSRGMGYNLPGLKDSGPFLKEVKKLDIPVRVSGQRAVSGFTRGAPKDEFKGYSIVKLKIPREAILSDFLGLKIQGSYFPKERESLILGAAEIAVPAGNLDYVPKY